ncbi:MAG TPA: stage 0 sporulation family protein [Candidatus Faecaligallichristensenella faecipullorum]|nr:stage 0 sporulation family protein [Candidatus Faecaligallichristensenella faecipullorum]
MATVIGVRFKKAGKVYYFDPAGFWPRPGDAVVVETSRGIELGEVVTGAREVPDEQIVPPLKQVVRVATAEDIARAENNAAREKEAYVICQEKILQHKLEMKLVDVEYTFDNSKIIFYFTANGRVDFRELVKDLASVFKMRIELRQIGVRDEAKMLGGLGSCGRPICCGAFLGDFQPVSIKMAKEQNLSLNPTKISGQCGRLMCCLKYEQAYYESALKKLPKVGREVITPDGSGIITEINVIREKVRVRMQLPDGTFDVREYRLEEVSKPNSASPARPAQEPSDSDEKDLESFDGGEPDGPAEQMDENPAPEPRPRKRPNRDKPKGESGRRERPPRPERIQKETAERLSEPEPAFEIVPANSESPAESGYESPDKLFVPEDDPTE